jgi:hypothetical protein
VCRAHKRSIRLLCRQLLIVRSSKETEESSERTARSPPPISPSDLRAVLIRGLDSRGRVTSAAVSSSAVHVALACEAWLWRWWALGLTRWAVEARRASQMLRPAAVGAPARVGEESPSKVMRFKERFGEWSAGRVAGRRQAREAKSDGQWSGARARAGGVSSRLAGHGAAVLFSNLQAGADCTGFAAARVVVGGYAADGGSIVVGAFRHSLGARCMWRISGAGRSACRTLSPRWPTVRRGVWGGGNYPSPW